MTPGLRVAVDVAALRRPESGIGRYTQSLLTGLLEECPGDEWVPFFVGLERGSFRLPAGVNLRSLPIPRRLVHFAWRTLEWPTVDAVTGPIDAFHTSDWSHPPQKGGATITTVHDLGPLDHPEWYAPDIVAHHRRHNQRTVERADRIITISDFTRERLLDHFSVGADRVVVVPNGVSSDFSPVPSGTESDTAERYGITKPFVLYVGTGEARKNLPGLVRIFERVAREEAELDLVIVGGSDRRASARVHGAEAWTSDPMQAARDRPWLEPRVHRVGEVPRSHLMDLYRGAVALLFPTLYEGFGLPLLEAMASGCPVISSATSAVPEVVGDAGFLSDPRDESAFADAVVRAVADEAALGRCRMAGLERARAYTWIQTARRTRQVYEDGTARRRMG